MTILMLRRTAIVFFVAFWAATASAQSSLFVGKWQSPKGEAGRKVAYTVNIVERGEALTGKVSLANFAGPDRVETITKASVSGRSLKFETTCDDGAATFYWELKLTKHDDRAILRGVCHELMIEEKVAKAKTKSRK